MISIPGNGIKKFSNTEFFFNNKSYVWYLTRIPKQTQSLDMDTLVLSSDDMMFQPTQGSHFAV